MGGIRAELAELNTQFLLGRFAEAMAHASKLEPRVQALRGRSQQAEALLVMGRIASQAQLPDQAAHWYEAAARAAELGRADRASAEARIRLFGVLGSQSPATVQAESAAVAAAAALEHLGRDPQLEALLELEQGDSAMARGAVSEVLTHHRQAIAAVDHVDLVPLQRATLLGRAAFGCFEADDLSGAQAANQQALALWEHVLGPHHPFVAKTLSNLGLILRSTGDLDGARALFIRALAIRRAALPPDHPDIAHSLYNLGCVEATVGRHDAAAPLIKEALGIYGRVPANLANPQLGKMLTGLATVESAQRQHDVTRPSNLRALRVLLHAVCPTHPDVASLYDRMAEVDMDVGRSSTMRSLF
jgi:tetratricopeptide (TPR) repeat protein